MNLKISRFARAWSAILLGLTYSLSRATSFRLKKVINRHRAMERGARASRRGSAYPLTGSGVSLGTRLR